MSEPIKVETPAHAVVLGRVVINRSPLELLKHLHANIGWSGALGPCIRVDADMRKQMLECIQFYEGQG